MRIARHGDGHARHGCAARRAPGRRRGCHRPDRRQRVRPGFCRRRHGLPGGAGQGVSHRPLQRAHGRRRRAVRSPFRRRARPPRRRDGARRMRGGLERGRSPGERGSGRGRHNRETLRPGARHEGRPRDGERETPGRRRRRRHRRGERLWRRVRTGDGETRCGSQSNAPREGHRGYGRTPEDPRAAFRGILQHFREHDAGRRGDERPPHENRNAQTRPVGGERTHPNGVRPSYTTVDGDMVFALSCGDREAALDVVGAAAIEAVGHAICRAVMEADGGGIIPAWRDLPAS